MRIFGAIVEPMTDFVAIGVADLFHRGGIRAEPVGDDALWSAIFFMMRFKNFRAAASSRFAVTTVSKTSPSRSTGRQR